MGPILGIGIAGLVVGYLMLRGVSTTDPQRLLMVLKRFGSFALTLIAVFLFARGAWLPGILFGAAAYGMGRMPLHRLPGGQGGEDAIDSQSSRVTTKWLDITLNRRSGEVSGHILRGRFQGLGFAQLSREDLGALLEECRTEDHQSAAIISAYIERVYGASEAKTAKAREEEEQREQIRRATSGMSRDEALDVLGLEGGASAEEVGEAHRRLMMLVHPDRGGSDYLAAKINAAKAVLLTK